MNHRGLHMQATARAQPNIALIKYWGKRDTVRNLPAVGSISITLDSLYTETTVNFDTALDSDELTINDVADAGSLPRISRCLDSVAGTDRARARVTSVGNFPIAAGLASSASAFAAVVVAADAALARDTGVDALAALAGQASGSAARSLYGGFVELANSGDRIEVGTIRAAETWPLRVVVAITTDARKPIGSGEAMETSRRTSPFYERWVNEQAPDLDAARAAIAAKDFEALAAISEHNCLKMHSVMWTSRPPAVYWNAATLDCMTTVRDLRAAGHAVFFTIDAGPQVKAVCLPEDEAAVRDALADTPGVTDIRVSGLGTGARRLTP